MSASSQSHAEPGVRAVIALGANLGDRGQTLLAAVRALANADGVELLAVSPLFESAALTVDGVDPEAPRYLNGVAIIRTILPPQAVLELVNEIEDSHGRIRTVRWGDRTLDLDIIDYGGLQLESRQLSLPHPRAAERDFVLVPWLRVDPDATIPGLGRADALLKSVEVTVIEAQHPGAAAGPAEQSSGGRA